MIKTNVTDQIVTAAKSVGGTGATIIPARGTGIHEAKTFFGLTLEAQTDVSPLSSGGKPGSTGAGFNIQSRPLKGSRNGDCFCDRRGTCRWTRKSTGAFQAGSGKSRLGGIHTVSEKINSVFDRSPRIQCKYQPTPHST